MVKLKTYIVELYLQIFNKQNYALFKIVAEGFVLKYFQTLGKFQPQCSHKLYSYTEKRERV